MNTPDWQARTQLLTGTEVLRKLHAANVFVAGLGGVGAYTAEMLCRTGIGNLCIADSDVVQSSNRNRQLIAMKSTEGKEKVKLMSERLLDINPKLNLKVINTYLDEKSIDEVLKTHFDYVADAIDTLNPKVSLIWKTVERSYPLVSSMGSGGKFDPTQIQIVDISESYNCRLAYSIRKQLHKRNIRAGVKVVFSPEPVSKKAIKLISGENNKKSTVGTISYMPAIFGCFIASVIIRDLIGNNA
jgi:tRNA threonylcarbamoyladenosine dehydratase